MVGRHIKNHLWTLLGRPKLASNQDAAKHTRGRLQLRNTHAEPHHQAHSRLNTREGPMPEKGTSGRYTKHDHRGPHTRRHHTSTPCTTARDQPNHNTSKPPTNNQHPQREKTKNTTQHKPYNWAQHKRTKPASPAHGNERHASKQHNWAQHKRTQTH